MRIGLMSDTHGNTKAVDKAVSKAGEIDVWLHAGDLTGDAEYLRQVYDAQVQNVCGNCDGFLSEEEAPEELWLDYAGHKIFLTHGHLYRAKSNPAYVAEIARELGADIAVYGHTHVAVATKVKGVLLLNPGSLTYPRDGEDPSFMVLELNEGQEPEVYHYHISW